MQALRRTATCRYLELRRLLWHISGWIAFTPSHEQEDLDMFGLPARRFCCLFALLCCLPAVTVIAADDKPRIEGAWRMVGQLLDSGEIRETEGRAVKFIMGGQWCVTAWDPNSGKVVYHHGGTYTFDGQKYVENVKYVAPLQSAGNLGHTFQFNMEFKGKRVTQRGIGNPYNEVWERIRAEKDEK